MLKTENIGRVVKELREERGWTLEHLAELADLDKGNLAKMEKGKVSFTMQTLPRIAKSLGVTASDIVTVAEADQITSITLRDMLARAIRMSEQQRQALLHLIDALN